MKHLFYAFALVALVYSCKSENKEASTNSTANQADTNKTERSGQAFITDDEMKLYFSSGLKNILSILGFIALLRLDN